MITKCRSCGGRGFFTLRESGSRVTCSTCGGKGSPDVPDKHILCPECKGSGHGIPEVGVHIENVCRTCFGVGYIDKDNIN